MKKVGDMTLPEMLAEIEAKKDFKWPDFIHELFPALLIFYRPNAPRKRRGRALGQFPKDYEYNSDRSKEGLIARFGSIKNAMETRYAKPSATVAEQNNSSVLTAIALSVDDVGTIRRVAKHRGYSKLVSLVYATPEEIELATRSWRIVLWKYKTFRGLYRIRGLVDPAFQEICERLHIEYPSKATGQTRGIQTQLDLPTLVKPDPDPLNIL